MNVVDDGSCPGRCAGGRLRRQVLAFGMMDTILNPGDHWATGSEAATQRNPQAVDHQQASHGPSDARAVLYWIPLGAGATVVRRSGRLFEAVSSCAQHRPACDLYHSALELTLGANRCTIEMTPVPARGPADRGVVGGGAVGSAWLGRLRVFRYEIRRWTGGTIPDAGAAIDGPTIVTTEQSVAQRIFELVPRVPTPVWGRDELGAGEMWNSNSVTSWLLARAGVDFSLVNQPLGGRAPGWDAGVDVASRSA